jgi:2-C-methyl-D-erythritol 4-phosphate cytidylyltransferase
MDAILLSAGKSERFNNTQVKQLIRLGGKPLLIFSLDRLLNFSEIENILLTIPPGEDNLYQKILEEYGLDRIILVSGGKTRQESVYNALQKIKTEKVIIHEAARPNLTEKILKRLCDYKSEVAVVPTIEIPFTVSVGNDYMERELDRQSLRNIQLPQLFDTKTLIEAHNFAKANNMQSTEDSMLIFRIGKKVRFIEGEKDNIKVTYPIDLILAQAILFQEWKRW